MNNINLSMNPTNQPPITWMPAQPVAGCPPGLEYLMQVNQLVIKQLFDLIEVFTDYDTNNKYLINNTLGQSVYYAKEENGCCIKYWCGINRSFVIFVYDNAGQAVMKITRPLKCRYMPCCSCSTCSRDELEVQAPPGEVIGYVKQLYQECHVRYAILDKNKEVVLRLHGPHYCFCYCPGDDYPVNIVSANGDVDIGKITKQWSGWTQELFTTADNFGVQFPMDLDVKYKAVILAAVFLIDFMYFENKQNKDSIWSFF